MKLKYQILQTLLVVWGLSSVPLERAQAQQSNSSPKLLIGIASVENRWVTLTDSSRVRVGQEIQFLLGKTLLDSGRFTPVLEGQVSPASVSGQPIPNEWTQWISSTPNEASSTPVAIRIQPVVEAVLYAIGTHSDRLTYGFQPGDLNSFNEGRDTSLLDNEFIVSDSDYQQCRKPDFLGGSFTPQGWGPFRSNFGANFDEGAAINIAGYGLGFKEKRFEVKLQIRFIMDDERTGKHAEFVFRNKSTGTDVYVAGAYGGISLGLEIQQSQTLVQALNQILPTVVTDLMNAGFPNAGSGDWQSTITSVNGSSIIMGAGTDDGISQGLQLASIDGSIFQVQIPQATQSVLTQISGSTAPYVGEVLKLAPSSSSNEKVFSSTKNIVFDQQARAAAQASAIQNCVESSDGISQDLEALFTLVAWIRYATIFDQPMHSGVQSQTDSSALKIAVIDSGVDYNDADIGPHVLRTDNNGGVLGFDFLSWDLRPSDDNGHGSAVAKFLAQNTNHPFTIVPIKVVGAYAETHSSAIYNAFDYAVKIKADAILVAWAPQSDKQKAYSMGAALARSNQIPIFLATDSANSNESIFSTQSLGGAMVTLDSMGVATVKRLAAWLASQPLGRSL